MARSPVCHLVHLNTIEHSIASTRERQRDLDGKWLTSRADPVYRCPMRTTPNSFQIHLFCAAGAESSANLLRARSVEGMSH
jgi:hypothetical protein